MTCYSAHDLLFDEQEGLLSSEQSAMLRAHLDACAECRAEEAALRETYAVLSRGVQAMVAPITPSPAFWQGLSAGLDAVDAERRPVAARVKRARMGWRHRWLAAGALLAATLTGLLTAAGGPRQAWADLRHLLFFVPGIGIGQAPATALVAAPSAPATSGGMTLSVTGLVSGRSVTLLSYRLSGRALLNTAGVAPVADAVEMTLSDSHGRHFAPTYWLPVRRGLDHGTPTVQGLLAFPALPQSESTVRLIATRLPLAPKPARPWSLTLTLRRASQGGAQMSRPVDSGATQHGIRVTVTDVTRSGQTLVVDMATKITGGPYTGGTVVSLAPELATGDFAPVLTIGHGGALTASVSSLTAPVRLQALPQPEFIFQIGSMRTYQMTLTVPAIDVREQASTALSVAAGPRQRVTLGGATLGIAARLVAPPAGLGLGGARRLRLTLTFPPASAAGRLHSVSIVVNGVSQQVSRDDPRLDLPLAPGQRAAGITLEDATVAVHGPWTIAMNVPGA